MPDEFNRPTGILRRLESMNNQTKEYTDQCATALTCMCILDWPIKSSLYWSWSKILSMQQDNGHW